MANQHTPEAQFLLRVISGIRPTCHLCSWVWDHAEGLFVIKRPSANCGTVAHRKLLAGYDGVPVSLRAWLEAAA